MELLELLIFIKIFSKMAYNIIKTHFEGVFFFQSDIFSDNRGEFSEIFSEKIFSEKIGNIHFVQDNFSVSKK